MPDDDITWPIGPAPQSYETEPPLLPEADPVTPASPETADIPTPPGPADSVTPGPPGWAVLAAEIAQLRDLFRRRLYDDRRRGQLYDALEEQSRKLSAVLTNRALADVFLEVLLSVDLLLDDRLTLAVARDAGEQILEAFARRGFAQVATSPVFDPATQEAVDKVAATPELPPGAVVQVVRPGFRLQDKLLRPAQVIVAVQE